MTKHTDGDFTTKLEGVLITLIMEYNQLIKTGNPKNVAAVNRGVAAITRLIKESLPEKKQVDSRYSTEFQAGSLGYNSALDDVVIALVVKHD